MSFRVLLFLSLFVAAFLVGGAYVYAASINVSETSGLVPCGFKTNAKGLIEEGFRCQACHAFVLIDNVVDALIVIGSIVAAMAFAYAGFLMFSARGDTGQIGKAHGIFWDVFWGFIFLLSAWLIVDTIMKALVSESFFRNLGPWNQLRCVGQPIPKPLELTGSAPVRLPSDYESQVNLGRTFRATTIGKKCTPAASGPCSPDTLREAGWGEAANNASTICMAESTGNPLVDVFYGRRNTDKMYTDGEERPFSIGLFQINTTQHNPANTESCRAYGDISNCTSALARSRASASDCRAKIQAQGLLGNTLISQLNLNGGYCHEVVKPDLYARCVSALRDSRCNSDTALGLYQKSNWQPWALSRGNCGI